MSLKLEEQAETLPSDWRRRPIREICEIGGGKTPRKSTEAYWGGTIPWVSSKDFDGSRMLETEDHLTDYALQETSVNKYTAGDIVMVVRSGVLKHSLPVAILGTDATVNQDIKVLQPDQDCVDNEYLLNALLYESDRIRTSCMKTGTTVQSIEMSFLEGYKLPIPSLEEQRRIAEVLSTVDEKIRETEEIIETTEELKRGLMQDLFRHGVMEHTGLKKTRFGEVPEDWAVTNLAEHCEIVSGSHVKSDLVSKDSSLTPYLTGPDDFDSIGVTVTKFTGEPTNFCQSGDTLITVKGSGCGQSAFVTQRACISRQLKSLRPCEEIDPKFLFYYTRIQQSFLNTIAEGTSIPGLSISDLETLPLPVPSEEEQEQIAKILWNSDQKVCQEKEHKEKLQQLKRGLMQDLLTGKVRTPESISASD